MTGRHQHRRPWLAWLRRPRTAPPPPPPPAIDMVDGPTGVTHRVGDDAFVAGRLAGGHYWALCGAQVHAASLTDPGRGYCLRCPRPARVRRS